MKVICGKLIYAALTP
nr:hypothetical protein [Vibrio metoecus]